MRKVDAAMSVFGENNKWVGNAKPTFHIGRFCYLANGDKKTETRAMRITNRGQHRMLWTMANGIRDEKRERIGAVFPAAREYPGPRDYVFMFRGKKEEVDDGVELFEKEIARAELLFKVSVLRVDVEKAVAAL